MMSREVRIVPEHWQHPKDAQGKYIPLYGWTYSESLEDYKKGKMFDEDDEDDNEDEPRPEEYMPEWPEHERTHLMMYETCSEGTPISPACKTAEELARWLADNDASAFGKMTATYDEWLAMINRAFATSLVLRNGQLMSGVEDSY
jgi:hypothetical protein